MGSPTIEPGTSGWRAIQQTTPQIITNRLDFDMDIQQAVSAHVVPGLSVVEEPGVPQTGTGELSALGNDVMPAEHPPGNAHALTIEYGEHGIPAARVGGTGEASGSEEGY